MQYVINSGRRGAVASARAKGGRRQAGRSNRERESTYAYIPEDLVRRNPNIIQRSGVDEEHREHDDCASDPRERPEQRNDGIRNERVVDEVRNDVPPNADENDLGNELVQQDILPQRNVTDLGGIMFVNKIDEGERVKV